jgi:hypothetical protein
MDIKYLIKGIGFVLFGVLISNLLLKYGLIFGILDGIE